MLHALLTAIALVFIIEGILPFACPDCWRKSILKLAEKNNHFLHLFGFISMTGGVVLLFLVR